MSLIVVALTGKKSDSISAHFQKKLLSNCKGRTLHIFNVIFTAYRTHSNSQEGNAFTFGRVGLFVRLYSLSILYLARSSGSVPELP